jgi:tetratricopeptide (TPR) repeat protein
MRRWALFLLCAAAARDYSGEIYALIDGHKAPEAQPILEEWKAHGGEKDPEYFIAGANLWHELARTTVVEDSQLGTGVYQVGGKSKDGFVLEDPKTKKAVGSIRFSDSVDDEKQRRAYGFLAEGARRFPERLDIPVGLAHLHREAKDLPGELAALRAFVMQARALKIPPLWGPKPLNTTAEALGLSMLNRYAAEHFGAGEETAGKSVGELTVELYPDKPHGYNLVSHYFADSSQWELTRQWLEKALVHAPEDSLVLSNLADCQERLGHHKEAVEIWKRIVQLDNDPTQVAQAKRALKKHR